jgi:hypothetical protein
MSGEKHGGIIPTGITPDSSTRAIWKPYQQSSRSKEEEQAEEIINLALQSIFSILPN